MYYMIVLHDDCFSKLYLSQMTSPNFCEYNSKILLIFFFQADSVTFLLFYNGFYFPYILKESFILNRSLCLFLSSNLSECRDAYERILLKGT